MRTTINLPDGLAEAAKRRAREENRTFTSLVEEGLRRVITDRPVPVARTLPAFGSSDGPVLVDLMDRDAVWALLDADGAQ